MRNKSTDVDIMSLVCRSRSSLGSFPLFLLSCILLQEHAALGNPGCNDQAVTGYSSLDGCTAQELKTKQLRVVYLDKQYVTQNQAAIAKAKDLGRSYAFASTCEKAATALPEWYA
jgi:hypothetical protein